jgi:nucleotide-binding universal stress UspA family protein
MSRFHHLLVPFDGSPSSGKALDEAIRLARSSGAKLTLIHVMDALAHMTGFESAKQYTGQIIPLMRSAGERLLAQAGQKVLAQGLQLECVLITEGPGRVFEHVAEHARTGGVDLIVLGSHGRRGVARALLGSDAEQIIRYAPVPVLVVRSASP